MRTRSSSHSSEKSDPDRVACADTKRRRTVSTSPVQTSTERGEFAFGWATTVDDVACALALAHDGLCAVHDPECDHDADIVQGFDRLVAEATTIDPTQKVIPAYFPARRRSGGPSTEVHARGMNGKRPVVESFEVAKVAKVAKVATVRHSSRSQWQLAAEHKLPVTSASTVDLYCHESIDGSLSDNRAAGRCDLKDDKTIVLAAIARYGLALQFASDGLKADPEVVLAAVAQNGLTLEFASDGLRADPEFMLAAVERNRDALEYASKGLRTDREFMLALGGLGGSVLGS